MEGGEGVRANPLNPPLDTPLLNDPSFSEKYYLEQILATRAQTYNVSLKIMTALVKYWKGHSGSVVECLARDRGAAGSSLTGVTALWSLA